MDLLRVEELGELRHFDEAFELDQTHQAPAESVFADVDAFFEDFEEVLSVLDDAVVDAHFEAVQVFFDLAEFFGELFVLEFEFVFSCVDLGVFFVGEFVGVGD